MTHEATSSNAHRKSTHIATNTAQPWQYQNARNDISAFPPQPNTTARSLPVWVKQHLLHTITYSSQADRLFSSQTMVIKDKYCQSEEEGGEEKFPPIPELDNPYEQKSLPIR